MKKLLFATLLVASFCQYSEATPPPQKHEKAVASKTYVYVCESSSAYAYHRDRNCRGLARCKHTIAKETEKEAKDEGRTPCKICTR